MNRRGLFALLAGAVIAPGEIWAPTKKIFLPPVTGWFSEDITTKMVRLVRFHQSKARYYGQPLLVSQSDHDRFAAALDEVARFQNSSLANAGFTNIYCCGTPLVTDRNAVIQADTRPFATARYQYAA